MITAWLALAVAVCACAGNAKPGRRTASARSPDGIGCLDTLSTPDSLRRIVKLSVSPRDSDASLPPDFEDLLAQEFRARFRLPPKWR